MKTLKYTDLIGKHITVISYHYKKKYEVTGILKHITPTHLCLEITNEIGKKYNYWVFKPSGKHDCILTDELGEV